MTSVGLRRGKREEVKAENESIAEVAWFEIKTLTHITCEWGVTKRRGSPELEKTLDGSRGRGREEEEG